MKYRDILGDNLKIHNLIPDIQSPGLDINLRYIQNVQEQRQQTDL